MPQVRIYEVTNKDVFEKSLTDLLFLQKTGCVIVRLLRADQEIELGPQTILKQGDRLAVVGTCSNQIGVLQLLGTEASDKRLNRTFIEQKKVMVSSEWACDKTIRDSGITNRYSCMVLETIRSHVPLSVHPDLVLERGDILLVCGVKKHLDELTKAIGKSEPPIHETDLLTFTFGICLGIIIGKSSVIIGIPIGVGLAGGLLATGLIIGYLHTMHPLFGNVPQAARFILMELGILFFMAGVGIKAGSGLITGLKTAGITIFVSGAAITVGAMLAGVFVGRYFLKLNPAILFGAIAGGMTSTPALGVITKATKSNTPALGYAGVYAFAIIVLTIVGKVIMMF